MDVDALSSALAGCRLTELGLREPAQVAAVQVPAELSDWSRWLAEIGFLPGEGVELLALGPFGGDPLVVRVGDSTFALRRAEAACVRVTRMAGGGAGR